MSGNRSKRKKPKTAARKLSGTAPSKSSKPTASAHWQQTGGHIYRYHPPRADHPLLQSARQAVEVASLPKSVDLRQLCTPIRAQGKEESCTGFAAAAFRETSYVAKTGVLLPYYLAPAYLYGWTRINDGTFPKDSGASLAGEFAVLQQRGVCPESYLPYNTDPEEGPNPVADTAAQPFRIDEPVQVNWQVPNIVKSVLASRQTVAIGFSVYKSFESPDKHGVVPMPKRATEKLLGGHGVLVCGYDDAKSYWIIRNQWGEDWGDHGYCYMPYGYESFWMEAWTAPPAG
jgi:C1A family cysteine protease